MSFVKDNHAYEAWLARQCKVVKKDLKHKHRDKMVDGGAFSFLRATYFRWAKQIGAWCPDLMDAPNVLAVGDLHLENFGTWRDEDGRLVWGVNDFDEAATMPYTLDLARLVTSIQLAPRRHDDVNNKAATREVLRGYRDGLRDPQPALLFEGETWLWPHAFPTEKEAEKFWKKVKKYPKATPPRKISQALIRSLPKDVVRGSIRLCSLVKGSGSLGRPRYVVVAYWQGGQVLREAKARVPSAWIWANGSKQSGASDLLDAANGRYRAPDPLLRVQHKYVFRRIAGDADKIELGEEAGADIHLRLLYAMGFDLASIHAATPRSIAAIRKDLGKRRRGWLNDAAAAAAREVRRDYREWKKYMKRR